MPWTVEDVDAHMKDLSLSEKGTWVEVANKALAACEKAGRKDCDASAIKQANTVVGKIREALSVDAWLTESTSYTALLQGIDSEVRKSAPGNGWAYPVEVFDDFVVYEVGGQSVETTYFKAPYTKDADGGISLGAAEKVKKVTTYPLTESFQEAASFKVILQRFMKSADVLAGHVFVSKNAKKRLAGLQDLLRAEHGKAADVTEATSDPLTTSQVEFREEGVLLEVEDVH